jgi:hypothetical protein
MSQGVKKVQIACFGKRGRAVHPPADQPDGGEAVSEYLHNDYVYCTNARTRTVGGIFKSAFISPIVGGTYLALV